MYSRIIYYLLFSLCSLNAQNILDSWEFKEVYPIDNSLKSPSGDRFKMHNGELIQYGTDEFGNLHLRSNKRSINLSDLINYREIRWPITFTLSNNYIVFNYDDIIYILTHNDFSNIKFVKAVKLDTRMGFREIKIIGDELYLFDALYYSDCKNQSQNLFFILNLKNFESKEIKFKNVNGVEFINNGRRRIFDVNNGIISISDISNYRVLFFNIDKNKFVDSITYLPEQWVFAPDSLPQYICGDPYLIRHIQIMEKYKNSYSTIWRSQFINDSLFIIQWSEPDTTNLFNFYYDIYKYDGNKWIGYKKLNEYKKKVDDMFNPYNLWMSFSAIINNGNLISIVEYPNFLFTDGINRRWKEVNELLKDYYKSNYLDQNCLIYDFKID